MPTGAYFLPSRDCLHLVILPSIAAVAVGSAIVYGAASISRRVGSPRLVTLFLLLAFCALALIGLKGFLSVIGIEWQSRTFFGTDFVAGQRLLKVLVALVMFGLLWITRTRLPQWSRALASLGFGFAVIAFIRLLVLWHAPQEPPVSRADAGISGEALMTSPALPVGGLPRRAVWIIFDETDFGRVFGADRPPSLALPNLDQLARDSVFATRANSPASATLFSIPSLLTGIPVTGAGIRIEDAGTLSIERQDGTWMPFNSQNSIFGKLLSTGRDASVLGFLHPYCKLFALQQCDSFEWPEVGGLSAAFWANTPGVISTRLGHPNDWDTLTPRMLRLLPEYVGRDDALTFIHLNIPHLPAIFADDVLHLARSADPLTEYSHNLLLMDRTLGEIVSGLRLAAARHELLLVVSTDHWLRNFWYRPTVPETSRPVTLMMWRVGDTNGIVLSQPVSTVHTGALILSFLNGEITTQDQIASWWSNRQVFPSFVLGATDAQGRSPL